MVSVFLSHSSADKAFARLLVTDLRVAGVNVWLDEEAIEPGQSVAQRINQGLGDADFVLLLISSAFLKSNWTTWESNAAILSAVDSQRDSLVPVLIEDVWNNVPPLVRDKHFVDFRKHMNLLEYRGALSDLVRKLLGSAVVVRTERRPVVTVTGERDIEKQGAMDVAYSLGRRLARSRLELRTGVAEGTDLFFAKGVADELAITAEDPRSFLTQFTVRGRKPKVHGLGRVIASSMHSREEGVPELISDSDIVITVGGSKNTSYFGMVALFESKILIPIASTGGASADLFSLILSRFDKIFGRKLDRDQFQNLGDLSMSPDQTAAACVRLVGLISGQSLGI
jgi:hypothetical protein